MAKSYDRYVTCASHFFASRCMERGYNLTETADCVVKKEGATWTIDTQHPAYPTTTKKKASWHMGRLGVAGGVGTELKKLLKMVGITASPGCSCNKRAAIMDDNGIQWCKDNMGEIVSWLKEEASKRRLPFADFMGKKIVNMSIKRAEKHVGDQVA